MVILHARIARSRFIRAATAQLMTRRECRSSITAGSDLDSRVQMLLVSPAHYWFG